MYIPSLGPSPRPRPGHPYAAPALAEPPGGARPKPGADGGETCQARGKGGLTPGGRWSTWIPGIPPGEGRGQSQSV